MKKTIAALLAVGLLCATAHAQTCSANDNQKQIAPPKTGGTTITVDAAAQGVAISPHLYGIFFEEINHSGDGGLYAELIENRSFEDCRLPEGLTMRDGHGVGQNKGWKIQFDDTNKFPHWKFAANGADAALTIETDAPIHPNNVNYARLSVKSVAVDAAIVLANDGFWGIATEKDERYLLSVFARSTDVKRFAVRLIDGNRQTLASTEVEGITNQWQKFEFVLQANAATVQGALELVFDEVGTIDIDEVSLFPEKTWNNRRNGLRKDLVQKLYDLKPAFVRFPGGCIVEGCTLANAFRPTTTLGPNETRPSRWILWNYRSPQGLGLHEYLQLCEDIGAAALLVVNCGMACEFRDGGMVGKTEEELRPYIDEALNSLEYALGSVDTKFGALRAAAGHPEPFNLQYLQIGNENWGKEYVPRYKVMHNAIKAKYPKLKYISCIEIPDADVDLRDDHYYNRTDFFRQGISRYDNDPRGDREVYVGEFAVTGGVGEGNLSGALGEAAFMIGFERNGDLVTMSSYAPLFYNTNDRAWPVNLIGFDNSRCFGQPSYYVQQMFSANRGDRALPTEVVQKGPMVLESKPVGVTLAAWDTKVEYKDIVVEKADGTAVQRDASQDAAVFGKLATQSGEPILVNVPDCQITGDYTVRFKARKLDGAEGFLIGFNATDEDNLFWFNRGGWGNKRNGVEQIDEGEKSTIPSKCAPFADVETGRWYAYEVQVRGKRATLLEDGRKIMSCSTDDAPSSIVAIGHKDTKTGEYLVRVVNYSSQPEQVEIRLENLDNKTTFAVEQTVLSSGSREDRNTLEEPEKVSPKTTQFQVSAPSFTLNVMPNSLTNLRLK